MSAERVKCILTSLPLKREYLDLEKKSREEGKGDNIDDTPVRTQIIFV